MDSGAVVFKRSASAPESLLVLYNLYAVDARTGVQKWSLTTGDAVRSSPAVGGDGLTVFVGSWDGNNKKKRRRKTVCSTVRRRWT